MIEAVTFALLALNTLVLLRMISLTNQRIDTANKRIDLTNERIERLHT